MTQPDSEDADSGPAQQPATLAECHRCPLWEHATQAVGGEGPKHAPIMLVGEQPGDKEDMQGKPFVGPAGSLLDDALEAAGIPRHTVYVTNAVKHFKWEPRGRRRMHKTPAQREIAACGFWLERELEHEKPRVVVTLGATALKAVLHESGARLKDAMGRTLERDGRKVIATWHPSALLRAPDPQARERGFSELVEALRRARELVQRA